MRYVIKRPGNKYGTFEYAYVNANGDVTWSTDILNDKTYDKMSDAIYDCKYIVKDRHSYVSTVT